MNLYNIQSLSFSFKVWLAAVFVSPFFILGFMALSKHISPEFLMYYIVLILVGGLLSSPCFLLLWLVSYLLLKHGESIRKMKSILTPISFALAVLPFFYWTLGGSTHEYLFSLPYVAIVIAGIWYFKLGDNETDEFRHTSQ